MARDIRPLFKSGQHRLAWGSETTKHLQDNQQRPRHGAQRQKLIKTLSGCLSRTRPVPSQRLTPITKWLTLCSTTLVLCIVNPGGASSAVLSPSEESRSVFFESRESICFITLKLSVCTGACGTRPLGAGSPRMPETKVTMPSRKKSQWKPAGRLMGK
jgi:hypothetical protein